MDKFATVRDPPSHLALCPCDSNPVPFPVLLLAQADDDCHRRVAAHHRPTPHQPPPAASHTTSPPDIPAYAHASCAAAHLCTDEHIWECKWPTLSVDAHNLTFVLDELETKSSSHQQSTTILGDDMFGDFAQGAWNRGPRRWVTLSARRLINSNTIAFKFSSYFQKKYK